MSARGDSREVESATPPCPHFGLCGGCQLQHMAYTAQLERKASKLRALLRNFLLPRLQLHASPPLGYRNRIRFTLREVNGQLRAGYLGTKNTNLGDEADGPDAAANAGLAFVPITQCPIAAPLLWRATEAFLALAAKADWLRHPGLQPDQLELFANAEESQLQLTLYLRSARRICRADWRRILARCAKPCTRQRPSWSARALRCFHQMHAAAVSSGQGPGRCGACRASTTASSFLPQTSEDFNTGCRAGLFSRAIAFFCPS